MDGFGKPSIGNRHLLVFRPLQGVGDSIEANPAAALEEA